MRYARSYMFTLGADTDLKIDLTSALDTYLYVVRDGTVVRRERRRGAGPQPELPPRHDL